MKRTQRTGAKPSREELDFELMMDLERQKMDEIRKMRSHERVEVQVAVQVRPGNASEHATAPIRATTNDVSQGGCALISPVPLGVGDIYRLSFDRKKLDVPVVFARVLRCRLLREDAFEIGLAFFTEISLGQATAPAKKNLLD